MKKQFLLIAIFCFIPTRVICAQSLTSKISNQTVQSDATETEVEQALGKPDSIQHDCQQLLKLGKQMRWIYNNFPRNITSILIDNTEGNLDEIINTIETHQDVTVYTYGSDPTWIELYVFGDGHLKEVLRFNRSQLEKEFTNNFGEEVTSQVSDFIAQYEAIK